jgi:hypothetical protein
MAKQKFNFAAEVRAMLIGLGAQPDDGLYGLVLGTRAGPLFLKPNDNWLAARFDDVARAVKLAPDGSLNRYSGKWNWHFMTPTAADVAFLESQVRKLLLSGAERAPAE